MEKKRISRKPSLKHLIISLFISALCLSATAGNGGDTIIFNQKNNKKSYMVTHRSINKKYYHSLFWDIGYNRLDKSNMFTGAKHESAAGFPRLKNSTSTSFSVYTMLGRRISGKFSIMSGLGVDFVNYRFSKDVTMKEIDGVAIQVPLASVFNNYSYMKKSKLGGTYLSVPVLLQLKFHRFFVAAGGTGGLNIGSHTRVEFVDFFGNKHKYKDYDIHPATFRYGYSMRAGFRYLSLFANYYVSPLFPKNEGPQVYPFVMGISLRL
ncbi:MAG: PorT family protein [Prevotellaceae bacterium]|jgi:hypothetical protein|nr:PorT family protein [Prevotellaceae bacterium]